MKSLMIRCTLIFFGIIASTNALADMPSMKRTKQEKTFVFGDIRIRQSFNSMKNPMSPDFTLQVYDKKRLVLQLNDAYFDTFAPAPDGGAFVGLSNTGWPNTAAIIFDRRGRILLLAYHGSAEFDYCNQTSTMWKEWYNASDPQIRFPRFTPGDEHPSGIMLKDCHGRTIDLLDTVEKATERSSHSLRREINFSFGTR